METLRVPSEALSNRARSVDQAITVRPGQVTYPPEGRLIYRWGQSHLRRDLRVVISLLVLGAALVMLLARQTDPVNERIAGILWVTGLVGISQFVVAVGWLMTFWSGGLRILAAENGLRFESPEPSKNVTLKWDDIGDVMPRHFSKHRDDLVVTGRADGSILFVDEACNSQEVYAAVNAINIALEANAMPGWTATGDAMPDKPDVWRMRQIAAAPVWSYIGEWLWWVIPTVFWLILMSPLVILAGNIGEGWASLAIYMGAFLIYLSVPLWALLVFGMQVIGLFLSRNGVYADTSGIAVRTSAWGKPVFIDYARIGSVAISDKPLKWLQSIEFISAASGRKLIETNVMTRKKAALALVAIEQVRASGGVPPLVSRRG